MAHPDSDLMLRTLLEYTIADRREIPMSDVLASVVPAGVKAYLRASVRDRLRATLAETPEFSRVADEAPLANRIRDVFLRHSADAYVFTRDDFLPDLENALHFTENYVCRPRWTLRSFLFHTSIVISARELIGKLEYVTEYSYLPQLLRRTIIERHLTEVDSSTVSTLIRRIDSAVVREHTPRELALLARPIFEFFLLEPDHPDGPIPLRPLLLFFEDKELHGLHSYLTGVCHFRKLEALTLHELISLSEDFLSGKPVEAQHPPPPLAEPAQEELSFGTAESDHPSEPEPAGEAESNAEPEHIPEPVQPDGTDPDVAHSGPAEADHETSADQEPPVSGTRAFPDLNEFIAPEQRKRFIQTICDRDRDFYDLIIARLNEIHSWKEASGYIRELFEINTIDPFHDVAVQFTDIVQRRLTGETRDQS